MFSDNETDVDLLGFEDQVADVCSIVVDRSMLPVTVGLLGDWGSGKTSLLRMAAKQLRAEGTVVIDFSPWRIETYDDAKTALLDAVVTAVAAAVPGEDADDDPGRARAALDAVNRLRKRVRWMRVAGLAAKHIVTMTAPTLDELDGLLKDETEAAPVATSESVARDFNAEFRGLVEHLPVPVVVLVDDLDRCLPEQVLDVLQAIRLFLAVPGTAFVLATDERVVRDAVRLRYPQATIASETDLPQEYLEKIVQVPIRIPPLGPAQIETYLNLLIAERHCDANQLAQLRARASQIRDEQYLAVAMNLGIARECLHAGGVPDAAEHDFEVVSRVARLLSVGLKGNARQVKRFLNMLLLRRATARRRHLDVDDAVLTKLAVLEYTLPRYFQMLHRWQSQGDGRPRELREAEGAVAGGSPTDAGLQEVTEWLANGWLKSWLQLDPPLAGVDLHEYFILARDALAATAVTARRLPAHLQRLLEELASVATVQRTAAVQRTLSLDAGERFVIVEAGLERLPSIEEPGPLALALVDVTSDRDDLSLAVAAAVGALPFQRIKPAFPAQLMTAFGDRAKAMLRELMITWETQTVNGRLSRAAGQVRRRFDEGP